MELPTTRGASFTARVKPNASRTALLGYNAIREAFEFSLTAPPDKGKANQELLFYLKKNHGIACEIVAGITARKKRLRVL